MKIHLTSNYSQYAIEVDTRNMDQSLSYSIGFDGFHPSTIRFSTERGDLRESILSNIFYLENDMVNLFLNLPKIKL